MSDSYDRSYYEIALTNGQVLVALGILLGCVVGAFLSGLWVAKKAIDRQPVEVAVPVTAEPEAEPFEFFGEPASPASADRVAESSAAGVNVASSTAAEPAPPQSRSQDSRPQDNRPATQAEERQTEPSNQIAPKAVSVVAAEGAEKAAKKATQGQGTPPTSTVPAGARVIQVFSSNDQAQAENLIDKLGAAGYRVFLSPVEVEGRTMYRVRVGPFQSEREAEKAAAEIKRGFKLDTWITSG